MASSSRPDTELPKVKSKLKGRGPVWVFWEERYMAKVEKQQDIYRQQVEERALARKKRLQQEKEDAHKNVLNRVGPKWYQELSVKQEVCAEALKKSIPQDIRLRTTNQTMFMIIQIGILPLPPPRMVWKAMKFSEGDPVEFLSALYELINPNRKEKTFTLNDRILLSCIVHLAMPETLRELHIRLPSPPRKKKEEKQIIKPKIPYKKYASTYLVPYSFKKPPRKHTGKYTGARNSYLRSPYFQYKRKLMAEESPIKSIYRYKAKADKRQKLVLKYNQSTSDIQREKIHFQPSQANKSEITKESKSEGNINAERELKATDYEYDPLLPKNQLNSLDAELLPNSTTPNQTLPKYKKSKVKLKKQQKREKFTFTGNPDYKVYKSYETKEERNMRHKHKRKRRKKIKKDSKRPITKSKTKKDSEEVPTVYKELMISGVAIRNGQPYYIIAGITNHAIPRIRNYIINGVVNREDETIYIISGIMYEKEQEPEIKEPDTCSCMHLYDEYMSKRRQEHKDCIDVYVEYSRQMSGSKKSLSKKSLNKKALLKKSSSALSKKIRFMNYEFMISADKYEGQKSPLCIVSGVQGRTIFNEFLKSLQSGINLMSQRNCTCVVREVQKEDDGILKLIVAGVATSATNLKIVLKGIKKENDGNTLIICSDTALPKKSQIDKDRMVTFILGGVTPMKIVSPLNEIKFNPTKKDLKSCTDITATYTINGVPLDVNKCEYIIGYVKTLDDGTKTFTVDGIVLNSANRNNSIDYCCLTEMSQKDCECVTSYKNKSNLKTTNKMNQNVDGTPTYLMTGDAAKTVIGDYMNSSVSSIPSRTFIIGGVVPNEKGPPSYIISGVAALNSARRAIRYHGIPKNAMIIGGVKRQRDGTSIFIISGIAEGADWEDDEEKNVSEEKTVCTCLEKFNEYLKTATKIEMKTKREVKKESSETKLAKPAEVNYFPKYGQMNVLKATLKEMAADGYPIPQLFQCYKLPIFKLWLEFRSRKILTPKMKDDLLIESIEMWKHVQHLQIPKPKLPMTPREIRTITWYNVKSCRKKINTLIEKIKCDIRQGLVDGTRRFWPTTCAYDMPNPTFKDVFFAYCPWKEPVEPMAVRPWMRHEYKNLLNDET